MPSCCEPAQFGDLFTRENELAHFTASAWVVTPDRKKALMAYHNLYNSWAWLGGHADGERNLLSVAVREVCEESGLTPAHVRPAWLISQKGDLSQGSAGDIFSLEVLSMERIISLSRASCSLYGS